MEALETKRFREWILEAIDQIRHRKARPNSERICRLVQKNHPELPFQVAKMVLWKLVKTGDVLKMEYKGNTSYRNPSKMNRKYGKKKVRPIDNEMSSQSDVRYHSELNSNFKHSKRKRTRTPFCSCCLSENCSSDGTTTKRRNTMLSLTEDNQKDKIATEGSTQFNEPKSGIVAKGQCENESSWNQDTENTSLQTVSICVKCNRVNCVPYTEDIGESGYFCDHCKSMDENSANHDDGANVLPFLQPNISLLQETGSVFFSSVSECSNGQHSGEILHPKDWTVEEVQKFIERIGFCAEAELFRKQEVDGLSLLLMKRNDVLSNLNLRLGPALKIYQHISNLQKSSSLMHL